MAFMSTLGQIMHAAADKIVFFHSSEGHAPTQVVKSTALVAVFKIDIGAFFNLAGDFGFCRAAVGRIVLEAAVTRWIVRT